MLPSGGSQSYDNSSRDVTNKKDNIYLESNEKYFCYNSVISPVKYQCEFYTPNQHCDDLQLYTNTRNILIFDGANKFA